MFDEPGSADQFSIKDHVGSLVLVAVNGFTPQFPTAFGLRDTIRCKIAVVSGPNEGKVYPDAMIFGSKIVPQLRSSMHRVVLGKVALGSAKPGQNAPYQLDKFSVEEAELANKWVEANGPFEPQPMEPEGQPMPQSQPQQQPPPQQQPQPNPTQWNGGYPGQGQPQGQPQGQQQGQQQTYAGSYTAPPQAEQPPF